MGKISNSLWLLKGRPCGLAVETRWRQTTAVFRLRSTTSTNSQWHSRLDRSSVCLVSDVLQCSARPAAASQQAAAAAASEPANEIVAIRWTQTHQYNKETSNISLSHLCCLLPPLPSPPPPRLRSHRVPVGGSSRRRRPPHHFDWTTNTSRRNQRSQLQVVHFKKSESELGETRRLKTRHWRLYQCDGKCS